MKHILLTLLVFCTVMMPAAALSQNSDRAALLDKLARFRDLTDEVLLQTLYGAEHKALAGDTVCVNALIDVALQSDGGVSEEISGIVNDLLSHNTPLVLTLLSFRSAEEQTAIGRLATLSMTPDDFTATESLLRRFVASRHPRLTPVAGRVLEAVEQARKDAKEQ